MKKKIPMITALTLSLCLTAPVLAAETTSETNQKDAIQMTESLETSAESQTLDDSLVLSDDLYSFQMEIDGEVYQFPMTYENLTARGWVYDGEAEAEISPNQYTINEVFKKGDFSIYVTLMNLGLNVKPLSECTVAGVSVDDYLLKDTGMEIRMPKGISYSTSTLDDILAAYGDASNRYDGDTLTTLTYSYDTYQEIKFDLDTATKKITGIEVRNMVETEDTASEDEISTEIPELVKQYQSPSELGTDLKACVVELEGALYQIPAPVSTFLENGWTLKKEDSDEFVAAHQAGWVSLMKNNQTMKVMAENYTDQAVTIENCFLLSVESDVYTNKFSIRLPGDITVGMSKDDLLKALDGVEYETESSSTFSYYSINNYHSTYEGVDLAVNEEDGTISSIEVTHRPKVDELFQ